MPIIYTLSLNTFFLAFFVKKVNYATVFSVFLPNSRIESMKW